MALQPQQFQMFMKPSELTAMPRFEFGDAPGWGGDVHAMRSQKLAEADDPRRERSGISLTDQIEAEGVTEPLSVYHGKPSRGRPGRAVLSNGHHRFFVQEWREKQGEEVYLPVRHR